jgi:hypothetical protein
MALTRLHWLGYAAGALFLLAGVLSGGPATLARPAALAVLGMLLLTAVNEHAVNPRVAEQRAAMQQAFGSVDATPKEHPLRAQFGKLHGLSTLVELSVLLLGVAALYLTVRAEP